MERLYASKQLRELDRLAVAAGVSGLALMRRAAGAAVDVLRREYPEARQCAVFCGSGKNAGDGFIVAGLLADQGVKAEMVLVGREPKAGTDAGEAFAWGKARATCHAAKGLDLAAKARGAEVIVDALLGLGAVGEVRPVYKEAIEAINGSGRPVVALDLPSGLCADTGRVLGACVQAAHTVTFVGGKIGLATNEGPGQAGRVHLAGLGIPAELYGRFAGEAVLRLDLSVRECLAPRHRNAHKRAHGHLLVVGGNEGMGGAALLAAEMGLMAGAGLVSVATREGNVAAMLARRPELMPKGVAGGGELAALLERVDCLAVGPGLGMDAWAKGVFAAALESGLPMVVDADGLGLLAGVGERRDDWVLTPHPGEAGRLLGGRDVQADRAQAVRDLQARYGGVSLLKGQGSLVASAERVWVCPYGGPGLAVAGTGDVLTGLLGGLLAQGVSLADAACLGAVLHGRAGEICVAANGERGLLAGELGPVVRQLINGKVG